jgi:hypothetical protein
MKDPTREEIRRWLLTRIAADLDLLRRTQAGHPYGYPTACCDLGGDAHGLTRLCNQLGGIARNLEYDPRPGCDHRHHSFEVWLA